MKKEISILIVATILLVRCIDEISIPLSTDSVLVIEGLITNESMAHKVKISRSFSFNENPVFANTDPEVLGATVEIIEDGNHVIPLSESGNGIYLTGNFSGKIGHSYHLNVILKNGSVYTSKEERLLPNGAKSFEVCFENTFKEVSNGESISSEPEVTFKVNFDDNAETRDYYRWGYRSVYEVFAPLAATSPPCDSELPPDGCGPCYDPLEKCWATSYDSEFLKIDSDIHYNGKSVEGYVIYSEPANRRFNIGYAANIEQFSLTKTAYEYWSAIDNQLNNNGTIFETPNHQIRGNIVSQNNPQELVLGFFGASAKILARAFVSDVDVPGHTGPIDCSPSSAGCIPPQCIDCQKWPASSLKPDYWPN